MLDTELVQIPWGENGSGVWFLSILKAKGENRPAGTVSGGAKLQVRPRIRFSSPEYTQIEIEVPDPVATMVSPPVCKFTFMKHIMLTDIMRSESGRC